MKATLISLVVFALCALVISDDAPDPLFPCSFRMTCHISVTTKDGQEEIASSINELMRDNGDYWVWKSMFKGNEFIQSIIPDHEWSLIWRPDLSTSFRHDINTQKCYVDPKQLTPYKWIESKTYGFVWFDEPVNYEGKEATCYTAVTVGSYQKIDFEGVANFYVLNEDNNIVHINGTVTAAKKEIDVVYRTTSLTFEHNKPIDASQFIVQAPCPLHPAPAAAGASFKKLCYKQESASFATVSWMALLLVVIAALLNF